VAFDPDPDAPRRLRQAIDDAWPALTRLGLDDAADRHGFVSRRASPTP
jgi:hypothetical protein